MRPRRRLVGLVVVAAALLLSATQARPALPRVLMVTYSAGYQHDVVRRPTAGDLSTAERVVADLGRRSDSFEVSHVSTRDDLERLTATPVRAHGAVLFFTTGELPLVATVPQAIFQAVHDGGGSVDVGRGKRPDGDYALAWTKAHGRGRVIYTALGHEPGVWADARFQAHLLGAIRWALGRS